MRPVTPFMMMPTEWKCLSLMYVSISGVVWLVGALRAGSGRKRGRLDTGPRQGSSQFLLPVSHIAGRPIAINHAHRSRAGVGELMKDMRWDVDGLARLNGHALFAEAHLAGAFNDEVDLFLVLVVPWHLPAVRRERDVAHGEVGSLDATRSADEIQSACLF